MISRGGKGSSISGILIQLESLLAKTSSRVFSTIFGIILRDQRTEVSPISCLEYQGGIVM